MIRTVLAEDNLLVRAGIEALLDASGECQVVGVCTGYDQLLQVVSATRPEVLVTDIRMPPTYTDEGIRAAVELRTAMPDTGVVVLSQYLESNYLRALIADGTGRRGYLLKERVASRDELMSAIRVVASGGSFIDPLVVESLVVRRHAGSALDRLTPRERQTLAQIASGKSNAAIASTFGVSHRAIEKHINSIFTKLDLSDDADINRRVCAVAVFLGS